MKVSILFVFCLGLGLDAISGTETFQRSLKKECPTPEDIPKCSCTSKAKGLSVKCKAFKEDSELQTHLKNLQGHFLQKLEINNYVASSIPTDLWHGLEIEDMSLAFVEVGDASFRRGKRHFQGLENTLNTLQIRDSFKSGHRPLLNLQLDHLGKMQHIILESNSIPEVGNDWFTSGPKELSTLIFEKNGIEELGDQAFNSLNNLKLLAVAGNHINSISRSMLPRAANSLITLDFAYNTIRTLPKDIFSGMPSLKHVNLDYNFIYMIEQDTWKSVSSQITSLTLVGNMLLCDEKMQWICKTNLKKAQGKCGIPIQKKGLSLQQLCRI